MSLRNGTAEGIFAGLEEFFDDLRILNWKSKLIGLGTDGASVNTGIHAGVGALLQKEVLTYFTSVVLLTS